MDLVSIVIPCYNPTDYLIEALASVAAQTHRETEIIIVNDGTKQPESLAILEEAARKVSLYIEQPNRGLGAARNTGFARARGEFVVPLDADDLLEPSYVSETLKALHHNREAAFAYTDFQVFGSHNYQEQPGEYNLYRLLDRNFLAYSSMIRREDWEQAGRYDETGRCHGYEDWELWLRLGSRGRFGQYVPKSLFRYRKHGASLYDEALARHQEFVGYIQARHPELYEYEPRARIKARWAPAVCIISSHPVDNQTIQDIQVIAPGETGSASATLHAGACGLEPHSAELAALAAWGGRYRASPPAAQGAPRSTLLRHLQNAGLLSWESWLQHPVRSATRLIPLRVKERINRAAGRALFDLSFYLQFQPASLQLGNSLIEPLRYFPRSGAGRKRVAFVTPHLGPGGAEAVLFEIASTLCKAGFELLLLATHSRDDRWRAKWQEKVEHVYDLAALVDSDHMVAAVCSVVSNWNCDFVLVQNSLFGYAALPHIRRRCPAAKVIDVVHNIDDEWDVTASTAQVAGCIDIRVAVSDLVRKRLQAAGTPEDRVRLLRNAVDPDRFQPTPQPAGPVHQILFAGRLEPVKRPLLLVDIAAQLASLRQSRDFRFVIAGDGPEGEELSRRIEHSGLEGIFEMRGQVDDLAALYATSDIVILPSRSEGVPLVVLEALACARPIVASDVGAVAEALDSSCGVLIEPAGDDAARFAQALNTLLNQPGLRERMGAQGRAKIEAGYNLRNARAAYAGLFA